MTLVLTLVLAAVILLGGCAQSGPGSSDSVSGQPKRSRLLRSVRRHQRKRQA